MSLFGGRSSSSFWDVFKSSKNDKGPGGRKNSYDPEVESFLAGLGIPTALSPEFLGNPHGPPPLAIEYNLKVAVVGGHGVGKTSVIRRYANDLFTHIYTPTIGVDLFSVLTSHMTSDGLPIRLSLWDISHHEFMCGHAGRALRDVAGVIFVFDACDRQSVKAIDEWRQYLATNKIEGIPLLLLANKIDKGKPILTPKNLDDYVRVCNYTAWTFTTARDGTSVLEGINRLVSEITQVMPLQGHSKGGSTDHSGKDSAVTARERRNKARLQRQSAQSQQSDDSGREPSQVVNNSLISLRKAQREMTEFYTSINQKLLSISDQVSKHRVDDIDILQRQRSNEFEKTRKLFESARNWVPHASDPSVVSKRIDQLTSDVHLQYSKWRKVVSTLEKERALRGDHTSHRLPSGRALRPTSSTAPSTSTGGPDGSSRGISSPEKDVGTEIFATSDPDMKFPSFAMESGNIGAVGPSSNVGSLQRVGSIGGSHADHPSIYSTDDSSLGQLPKGSFDEEEGTMSYRTSFTPNANSLRTSLQGGTSPATHGSMASSGGRMAMGSRSRNQPSSSVDSVRRKGATDHATTAALSAARDGYSANRRQRKLRARLKAGGTCDTIEPLPASAKSAVSRLGFRSSRRATSCR